MPRISVIIPVYNMEKYLSRCLDSVIGQTFCDFEVICIDDGSKDKSLRVLQDYAKRDKRIVVISQPNGGVSVARNVGLNLAKAPTICFIDADDYVHPEMLACMHKVVEDKKVDVVSCLIAKVNEKFYTNYTNTCPPPQTQPTNTEKLKILEFSSPLDAFMRVHSVRTSCCAKLYKREILKGIYFEPNIRFEDIPFTLEVMNKAKNLALLKAPLYFYRQNPESFIHQPFTADASQLSTESGGEADETFATGIIKTVNWYSENMQGELCCLE